MVLARAEEVNLIFGPEDASSSRGGVFFISVGCAGWGGEAGHGDGGCRPSAVLGECADGGVDKRRSGGGGSECRKVLTDARRIYMTC